MPVAGIKPFSLPYQVKIPSASNGSGANAFTALTADFTQPAVGADVVASVGSSAWAAIGQVVFVAGTGGYYIVTAKPTATSLTLMNLGYAANASPGATVPAPSQVSPAGLQGPAATIAFAFNETSMTSTDVMGVGPGGFSADWNETGGYLITANREITTLSARLSGGVPAGEQMTLRVIANSGGGYVQIGDPLIIPEFEAYGSVTFSPFQLLTGDEVAVRFEVSANFSRHLATAID